MNPNYCERCGMWLAADDLVLCNSCAGKASARPERSEGQAAPEPEPTREQNRREAAARLEAGDMSGAMDKIRDALKDNSALASAAFSAGLGGATARAEEQIHAEQARQKAGERMLSAMEQATARDINEANKAHLRKDPLTYERMLDELDKLRRSDMAKHYVTPPAFTVGPMSPQKSPQKSPPRQKDHGLATGGYVGTVEWATRVECYAKVLRAIDLASQTDDMLTGEPWFTDERILHDLNGALTRKMFRDAIDVLTSTGLIERDTEAMLVRMRRGQYNQWKREALSDFNPNRLQEIRDEILEASRELHAELRKQPKRSDPTPWTYQGASEEALLAVEAMQPRYTKIKTGITEDGRRVYSVREISDHRPFEVVFDATGQPVSQHDLDGTDWTTASGGVSSHAVFSMAKDLLAALIVKLDRASIAYLCRGCGDIIDSHEELHRDPDLIETRHIVIGQDHNPRPGAHGYDGECLDCPIQVEQECGPIVQIGGAS